MTKQRARGHERAGACGELPGHTACARRGPDRICVGVHGSARGSVYLLHAHACACVFVLVVILCPLPVRLLSDVHRLLAPAEMGSVYKVMAIVPLPKDGPPPAAPVGFEEATPLP